MTRIKRSTNAPPQVLDEASLLRGVDVLAARDADLAAIVMRFGPPPLWERATGFATLVHLILEQQVSLASAKAAFVKLQTALGEVEPHLLLTLTDEELKAIGFSRQKTRYARLLAEAVRDGQLDFAQLAILDDEGVRAVLTQLKGIGVWTADCYLLMALRRPDVWPHGDLALAVAWQQLKQLPARPSYAELGVVAERWRPWRAVAARLLWHNYLSERRR
ncbi:MAG: DNA-3-methyladenine glycosylase 2 family protein [Acidobacteria bacterium]|nr:DNA-3-methyladenine glycosylase 2 family protein [Acidobacteriota bacterium]MBI3424416.1 DNA-3-methyladenine glycosylase 2 family protein [Acidobacteriota bacterium]